MSAMPNEIRKRNRETEVRKWTESKVKTVLEYMQIHRNLEQKPTAQLYYKKLLEFTKINASRIMLKCKVRHLKVNLQKAGAWSSSTGGRVEEGDGSLTVKDKVLKICPHYDQLSDIFSSTKEIEVATTDTCSDFTEYEYLDMGEDDCAQVADEPESSSADISFVEKVKRAGQKTCFDKMATMEAQRSGFRGKHLKLDTEKFEWSKEVEKKNKLEIENPKLTNEFEIKKLEVEQKMKIRQFELEQNERIKMYEIEMKYKNNK